MNIDEVKSHLTDIAARLDDIEEDTIGIRLDWTDPRPECRRILARIAVARESLRQIAALLDGQSGPVDHERP